MGYFPQTIVIYIFDDSSRNDRVSLLLPNGETKQNATDKVTSGGVEMQV